jgi:hypothetical protein
MFIFLFMVWEGETRAGKLMKREKIVSLSYFQWLKTLIFILKGFNNRSLITLTFFM